MNIIFIIFEAICITYTMITLIGLIIYKCSPTIKCWEDGIIHFFTVITVAFYWLTDKVDPDAVVDSTLCITLDEAPELVNLFSEHPLESPTVRTLIPNTGVGTCEVGISALGFVNKYRELTSQQFEKMAEHLIQNYFMKTRQRQVFIYFDSVSPTNLYFRIALSQKGRRILEKRASEKIHMDLSPSKCTEPLEETVDIFEDDLEMM